MDNDVFAVALSLTMAMAPIAGCARRRTQGAGRRLDDREPEELGAALRESHRPQARHDVRGNARAHQDVDLRRAVRPRRGAVRRDEGCRRAGKIRGAGTGRRRPRRLRRLALVRAGAAKPDVSTPDALRAALKAQSITFYPESAAGNYVMRTFERLGIAQAMKAKLKPQTGTGDIPKAVASGDAELGVFLTNVLIAPGVELAVPFPGDLQQRVGVRRRGGCRHQGCRTPPRPSSIISRRRKPCVCSRRRV